MKWINYIGTLAFGGFVDHTGGSTLQGDPALNRLTWYVPSDSVGFQATTSAYAPRWQRVPFSLFVPRSILTVTSVAWAWATAVSLGDVRRASDHDIRACGGSQETRVTIANIAGAPLSSMRSLSSITHPEAIAVQQQRLGATDDGQPHH